MLSPGNMGVVLAGERRHASLRPDARTRSLQRLKDFNELLNNALLKDEAFFLYGYNSLAGLKPVADAFLSFAMKQQYATEREVHDFFFFFFFKKKNRQRPRRLHPA